ncbi:MAG: type VI secretion system-associated FHA domain protein [Thermodesulfobacteriota bacterium]
MPDNDLPAMVGGGLLSEEVIKTISEGITSLIEVQRCFAEEFGLSHGRVFQNDFEDFKDRPMQEVLTEWLTGGASGADSLAQIIEDLNEHQIALISALDGVASEALEQLRPRSHRGKGPGVLGIRPMAWSHYRNFHRKLRENKNIRHQQLVMPGFVSRYVESREKSWNNKS